MEDNSKHAPKPPSRCINSPDKATSDTPASPRTSPREHTSASANKKPELSVINTPSSSPNAAPSPTTASPPSADSPTQTARQQREACMKHETERTCQLLREIWYKSERNDALLMANRVQTESVLPDLRLQRIRGINLSLARDRQILKRKGVQQEAEQMQRAREVRLREAENDRMEMEIKDMKLEIVERTARLHRQ